jgi:hypothetical protein
MKRGRFIAVALMAPTLFFGCSSSRDNQILKVEESISSAINQTGQKEGSFQVEVFNHSRISGTEIVLEKDEKTDPVFKNRISYYTYGVQKLSEVLRNISRMTGLNIRTQEIMSLSVGGVTSQGASGGGTSQGQGESAGGGQSVLSGYVDISFSGELGKLFDAICEQNDISWRADGHRGVEFFRYQSQNFSLNIPPGSKKMSASISIAGVGEESGASGGGSVSISNDINIDPWGSVSKGIRNILEAGGGESPSGGSSGGGSASGSASTSTSTTSSGGGGQGSFYVSSTNGFAVLNPDLGLVTVTARPVYLNRVKRYIESVNQRFAQNILIDFRIYNVSVKDEFAAGFSIESVVKQLNFVGGGLGLQNLSIQGSPMVSPTSSSPGMINIDMRYLNSNANPDIDGFANTVLIALNNIGKATLQTQGQVMAVNGQHAPFQVADQTKYVSGISQVQSETGITVSVETQKQISGVTANFIPLILGDNRILLQYQMQISQLLGLDTVSQGDYTVQLPRVSSQTLQQQIYMHDGQALLLFSFSQGRLTKDSRFSPLNLSSRDSKEKNLFCILLYVKSTGTDFNGIKEL